MSNPAFGPFLAFFLVYFCSTALSKQPADEKPMSAVRNCKEHFRIFIDVGHSMEAPGATSARGKSEFDFNLRLAQTLQNNLALSRTTWLREGIGKSGYL
jgi:hypothetical protein